MIKKNFSLQYYNTFGLNVKADFFYEFNDVSDLISLDYDFKNGKFFILGGGSNLLFTRDFNGLVIKSINDKINIVSEDNNFIYLKVGAGFVWDNFVEYCVNNNYGGVENLSLIPGTVGASAVQNIGAYGVEAKDIISKVYVYDLENNRAEVLSNKDCLFDYRYSVFKKSKNNRLLITDIEYKLTKNNHKYNINYGAVKDKLLNKKINLTNIRDVIINIRESKLPDVNRLGNAGSFFKNPIVDKKKFLELLQKFPSLVYYKLSNERYKLAAGWLIEQAGFKGFSLGRAGVYSKQSLVLINKGGAEPNEIIKLSDKIIETIFKKFSIKIEPEVIFV